MSLNGKFRGESLAMEWFSSRIQAHVVIDDWRQHYHTVRPHSSLNQQALALMPVHPRPSAPVHADTHAETSPSG